MTRPLALAALPLALAAVATFAAACGGSSSSSPDGGGGASAGLQLVVFRDTPTNSIIAHSIADGRRWQRFTNQGEIITGIDCTHDGGRAAYLAKRVSGGGEVRLSGGQSPVAFTGDAFGLAWAPDGSRIAVTSLTPGNVVENRLDLLDPGTGELTTVARSIGPIGSPRWSPDGTKIAYDATKQPTNVLFVYTIGQPAAVPLFERPAPVFAPDWAPDGHSLLFSALGSSTLSQIYTVGADGSNPHEITSSQVSKGVPRWSPDGSLVAFAGTVTIPLTSARPLALHNLAVYTMKPDGTGEQQLTDLQQDAWLLGWCVGGPWLTDGWEEVVG